MAEVAVFTDDRSAAVLAALGTEIDPATVRTVLSAADPVAAGIDAAVAEAQALLAAGAAGVNLSGLASARGTASRHQAGRARYADRSRYAVTIGGSEPDTLAGVRHRGSVRDVGEDLGPEYYRLAGSRGSGKSRLMRGS